MLLQDEEGGDVPRGKSHAKPINAGFPQTAASEFTACYILENDQDM